MYKRQVYALLLGENTIEECIIETEIENQSLISSDVNLAGAEIELIGICLLYTSDKVVRFADKNRHQVFIEPEGLFTNEMYVGGMSSSLPEDVQHDMYHSVPGPVSYTHLIAFDGNIIVR